MFLHDRFTLPARQRAMHIALIANFMLFLVLAETGMLTALLLALLVPM
jgi:F0F1-type ATP synthase membrane subunit c/vacuolar-type H+-ATPase subunit K